jgi:hypothetical protein
MRYIELSANLATALGIFVLLFQTAHEISNRTLDQTKLKLDNSLALINEFGELYQKKDPVAALYAKWEDKVVQAILSGQDLQSQLLDELNNATLTSEAITYNIDLVRLIGKSEAYRGKGLIDECMLYRGLDPLLEGEVYEKTKEVLMRESQPEQLSPAPDLTTKELAIIKDTLKFASTGVKIQVRDHAISADELLEKQDPPLYQKMLQWQQHQNSLRRSLLSTTRKPKYQLAKSTFVAFEPQLRSFQLWYESMGTTEKCGPETTTKRGPESASSVK